MTTEEKLKIASEQGKLVYEALKKAHDPFIDQLDEDDPSAVGEAKIIVFLLGTRMFIGGFTGLETVVVKTLSDGGILNLEHYASSVQTSSELGLTYAEFIERTMKRPKK